MRIRKDIPRAPMWKKVKTRRQGWNLRRIGTHWSRKGPMGTIFRPERTVERKVVTKRVRVIGGMSRKKERKSKSPVPWTLPVAILQK